MGPTDTNLFVLPRFKSTKRAMSSYGCHPATGGVCDCDWDTNEQGYDYFVQCDECAELWEKEPNAEWPYADLSLQEDSWAVLSLLDVADSLSEGSDRRKALGVAVAKALELDLLNRSDSIRQLFADWLPRLMNDEVVMADMGDVLRSCAEELACS